MIPVLFILPFIFVVVIAPILVALRVRSGNAWFGTQMLTLVGLIVAIVLIQRETFGDLEGVPQFLLILSCCACGVLTGAVIYRRKQSK